MVIIIIYINPPREGMLQRIIPGHRDYAIDSPECASTRDMSLYKPECDSTRSLYLYMLRAKGLSYINASGTLTELNKQVILQFEEYVNVLI